MGKKFLLFSLMLFGALFAGAGFAEESGTLTQVDNEKASPWAVNMWGLSHHPGGSKRLNNYNWGLGLRKYHSEHWFSDVNCLRNSQRGTMCTAGSGIEYEVAKFGAKTSLLVGGEALVMAYEVPKAKKTLFSVSAAPAVGLRYGNLSLNLVAIPVMNDHKLKIGVLTFFLGYRFE